MSPKRNAQVFRTLSLLLNLNPMTNDTIKAQSLALAAESLISAHPEQLSSELDGETILLQMNSGLYYGLNEMGAAIWGMIQSPKTFQEIQSDLLESYEVSAEVCKQEVEKLLSELHAAGLIEVKMPEAV